MIYSRLRGLDLCAPIGATSPRLTITVDDSGEIISYLFAQGTVLVALLDDKVTLPISVRMEAVAFTASTLFVVLSNDGFLFLNGETELRALLEAALLKACEFMYHLPDPYNSLDVCKTFFANDWQSLLDLLEPVSWPV